MRQYSLIIAIHRISLFNIVIIPKYLHIIRQFQLTIGKPESDRNIPVSQLFEVLKKKCHYTRPIANAKRPDKSCRPEFAHIDKYCGQLLLDLA